MPRFLLTLTSARAGWLADAAGRAGEHVPCESGWRGDPRSGRHSQPAGAHGLRHRPQGAPQGAGRRVRRGQPRRRQQPAGSPRVPHCAPSERRRHGPRRDDGPDLRRQRQPQSDAGPQLGCAREGPAHVHRVRPRRVCQDGPEPQAARPPVALLRGLRAQPRRRGVLYRIWQAQGAPMLNSPGVHSSPLPGARPRCGRTCSRRGAWSAGRRA